MVAEHEVVYRLVQRFKNFDGVGTVPDTVAEANDLVDSHASDIQPDGFPCLLIRMNIGDDRVFHGDSNPVTMWACSSE